MGMRLFSQRRALYPQMLLVQWLSNCRTHHDLKVCNHLFNKQAKLSLSPSFVHLSVSIYS